MTVDTWYWRTWSRSDHTPENWERTKREALRPDQVADRYGGGQAEGFIATALVADPEAPLPSHQITINTNMLSFAVQELRPGYRTAHRAAFHVATAYDGLQSSPPWMDDEQRGRREGQLCLFDVQGPLADGGAPERITSVRIRPNGHVHTVTRVAFNKDEPHVQVPWGPWPGLDGETEWFWADYPGFNEYTDLIEKADKAFDVFLSGPDPRLTSDPKEAS